VGVDQVVSLYISNWLVVFMLFSAADLQEMQTDCEVLAEQFNRDHPELNEQGLPAVHAFCQ